MRANKIKEIWAKGETVFNGWCAIPSSISAELMAKQDFDSVCLDLQHGAIDYSTSLPMLQAISTTDRVPLARVPWNEPGVIGKMLDAGAYGIICPMIDTPDDAQRFVSACRYPPHGTRSFGPTRGLLYGGPDYADHADDTVIAYGMIETSRGMHHLEEIVATQGLDGVFVGPADLSLALGVGYAVRWKEQPLAGAVERILKVAHAAGKMAGCFCVSEQMAIDMKHLGYDFVIAGQDAAMVRATGLARCDAIRRG